LIDVKFRCEREVLAEALGAARRAAASRSTGLHVLSGLHLALTGDELVVTGTDLDLTIRVAITVAGDRDGVAVLPGALTADIVRNFEAGSVSVDVDGDEVRLSGGRSQFSVRTLNSEEFPRVSVADGPAVTLPASDLLSALEQVVRAASKDESRPILTGVRLEPSEAGGVRMVATDSYRLALRDVPAADLLPAERKVLIPSKALDQLTKVCGGAEHLSVQLGERDVTFSGKGVSLTTRLIEGEFPNYRQLIPASHPNRLTVGKATLLDAIKRVKLLAGDSKNIRLGLRADGVELMSVSQEWGQASELVDAAYNGAEFIVAFNPDYLADGIGAIAGDDVILDTLDATKPAVLRSSEDPSFLYLLMPVRVS
jgi:DNA polymerase III subunit beta